MKFLLMAAAFYVLFWLLRRSWQRARPLRPPPPAPTLAEPEAMLRCVECGLHLPRHEALAGPEGVFCCEAHRVAHGRRSPA